MRHPMVDEKGWIVLQLLKNHGINMNQYESIWINQSILVHHENPPKTPAQWSGTGHQWIRCIKWGPPGYITIPGFSSQHTFLDPSSHAHVLGELALKKLTVWKLFLLERVELTTSNCFFFSFWWLNAEESPSVLRWVKHKIPGCVEIHSLARGSNITGKETDTRFTRLK